MLTLFIWATWATFTAIVMIVDRNLRAARGEVDFNNSPFGYVVLALLSPFLVLPVYFHGSRRNSTGGHRAMVALAGVGLTVACWALSVYQATLALVCVHVAAS